MLAAVQFHGELKFVAVEIENVGLDWMLPSELSSRKPTISQEKPHEFLGIGLLFAELAGEIEQVRRQRRMMELPFFGRFITLTPAPSPGGRGVEQARYPDPFDTRPLSRRERGE